MVEVVAAIVAVAGLVLTSGYGLGATRRRRAIRELIEIRRGIPGRLSARDRVDKLIEEELVGLERLGNANMRWFMVIFMAIFASLLVALMAGVAVPFVPVADARYVLQYISAGGFVLAGVVAGLAILIYSSTFSSKRVQAGVMIGAFLALLIACALAFYAIRETPYLAMLLSRGTLR